MKSLSSRGFFAAAALVSIIACAVSAAVLGLCEAATPAAGCICVACAAAFSLCCARYAALAFEAETGAKLAEYRRKLHALSAR